MVTASQGSWNRRLCVELKITGNVDDACYYHRYELSNRIPDQSRQLQASSISIFGISINVPKSNPASAEANHTCSA